MATPKTKSATASCLNCGATLHGEFCGACGQRAIAPYPTIGEVVGDAWQELSGYDGRFARTFRILLGRPGALTIDTLEGKRARYISPVRLYLTASLLFFLCAATVPHLRTAAPPVIPRSDERIKMGPDGVLRISPEQRDKVLKGLERAPWWAAAVIRPVVIDPVGFRLRFLEALPRVLFTLVPVFAGILSLFYRRRPFTQHLIFAIHLHTVVFMALAVRTLSQLTRSLLVLKLFEIAAAVAILTWVLLGFRRVYGESWPRVLIKGLAIAVVYNVVGIAALVVTLIWTITRG